MSLTSEILLEVRPPPKKNTLGMSQSSCFVWFWKQTSNSRNCIVLYFWSFLSGLGCVYFMVRRCHSNDSLGGQSCIEYWTRLRKDYATRSPSVATSWYIKNIQKQLETSCFYWNFELTDLLRSWTSLFVTKVPPLLDQGPSLGFGWLHCLQLCKMQNKCYFPTNTTGSWRIFRDRLLRRIHPAMQFPPWVSSARLVGCQGDCWSSPQRSAREQQWIAGSFFMASIPRLGRNNRKA